jgi:hypothetical protein
MGSSTPEETPVCAKQAKAPRYKASNQQCPMNKERCESNEHRGAQRASDRDPGGPNKAGGGGQDEAGDSRQKPPVKVTEKLRDRGAAERPGRERGEGGAQAQTGEPPGAPGN